MRYRSNLEPPDMSGFTLHSPVLQNCGHDCPSDPDFDPGCTFMTEDEIAILYATLHGPHLNRKTTVEIGSRFGWTAKAINGATGGCVLCVDPILKYGSPEQQRFKENLGPAFGSVIAIPRTSEVFFRDRHLESTRSHYSAFVIDGNHEDIQPTNDCKGALSLATEDCIVILHDARGLPVCRAAEFLMEQGFRVRFYVTPNGVFVAWRGFEGWEPPAHDPDPKLVEPIMRQMRGQMEMGMMS